jgi:cell division initiation protein
MALTPIELEGKEFSKARKGYNIEEVDKFFKTVLQEFEALYRENQELKDTCNRIRQDLGRYKSLESTITETLVTAQRAGEDARNNAAKEAEVIIREAKIKGEEMIAKVQEEIQEKENELKALIKQHQVAVAEMKLFLNTHLELLEQNGPSFAESLKEDDQDQRYGYAEAEEEYVV